MAATYRPPESDADAIAAVAAEAATRATADALLAPKASPTFTGTVAGVTKAHVGLSALTNEAQIPLAQKSAANGVASLDGDGLVPTAQLPSVESGSGSGGSTIYLSPSGDATGATDQAAVAAAIAELLALTPRGGELKLAAGDWYWNSQQIDIYATPARLKITGEGQATRVHNTSTGTAGTSKATFYVYGGGDVGAYPDAVGEQGAVGLNWLEISDMELVGSANSCGIALLGVYQGRLANIYGHGFTAASQYGSVFWLDRCIDLVIENPITFDCNYGAYLVNWSNINNFIGGWFLSSLTAGVALVAGIGYAEGNNFWGTVFQTAGAYGIDIGAGVKGTHLYGPWIENNSRGARINGIGTVIDSPICAANGRDFEILGSARTTSIRAPHFESTPSTEIQSGSIGTVIHDAPPEFTYAEVIDATGGAEVTFARPKRAVTTVGVSGAAQTVVAPQEADETVIQLTDDCVLTFPAPHEGHVFDLMLIQVNAGSFTVTWPASVQWPADTPPTLSTAAGDSDRFRFSSDDGVNWYGHTIGLGYVTGYGSSFSPSSLTPHMWLSADEISGVTVNDTPVSSWTDRSGNDHSVDGAGSTRPLLKTAIQNGLPAVLFDGTDDFLQSPTPWAGIDQPITIAIVASMTSGGGRFYFDGVGSSNRVAFGDSLVASGSHEVFGGVDAVGAAQAKPTGMNLWTVVLNGTSSSVRKNRAAFASGATNIGTQQWVGMTLGANQGAVASFLAGYVCELVAVVGTLTTDERDDLEDYLQARWATP